MKAVERKVARSAVSNVGSGLPGANHFTRFLGGPPRRRRIKTYGRRGNVNVLSVVGQALLTVPVLNNPSQGDVLVTRDINPHKLGAAALAKEADLWELDEAAGLAFHVPPASNTSDASVLVAAVDLDCTDLWPTGQASIDNALNHGGIMFATRNGATLHVPRRKLTATGWKFVDMPDSAPATRRQTNSGTFRLIAETGAGSTASVPIWITYHFVFKERALDFDGYASAGSALGIDNTTDAQLTAANPFGWGASGAFISLSGFANCGFPVYIGNDGAHSRLQIRLKDVPVKPDYLLVTCQRVATDCKGTWTLTQYGTSVGVTLDAPVATSMTSRCVTWVFALGTPVTTGDANPWTLQTVAGGQLSAPRTSTSGDMLSASNPGWEITFSLDSVSTPTDTFVLLMPFKSSAVSFDEFGPGTLQYDAQRAVARGESKHSVQETMAQMQRVRDDTVAILKAKLALSEAQRPIPDEPMVRGPHVCATLEPWSLVQPPEVKETPKRASAPQLRAGVRM